MPDQLAPPPPAPRPDGRGDSHPSAGKRPASCSAGPSGGARRYSPTRLCAPTRAGGDNSSPVLASPGPHSHARYGWPVNFSGRLTRSDSPGGNTARVYRIACRLLPGRGDLQHRGQESCDHRVDLVCGVQLGEMAGADRLTDDDPGVLSPDPLGGAEWCTGAVRAERGAAADVQRRYAERGEGTRTIEAPDVFPRGDHHVLRRRSHMVGDPVPPLLVVAG